MSNEATQNEFEDYSPAELLALKKRHEAAIRRDEARGLNGDTPGSLIKASRKRIEEIDAALWQKASVFSQSEESSRASHPAGTGRPARAPKPSYVYRGRLGTPVDLGALGQGLVIEGPYEILRGPVTASEARAEVARLRLTAKPGEYYSLTDEPKLLS